MKKDEIIAAYENYDEIIGDFSKEVGDFRIKMAQKNQEIMAIVEEIRSAWDDSGYEHFKKNMTANVDNINSSLSRCQNVEKILETASKQLNEALAKMRDKK